MFALLVPAPTSGAASISDAARAAQAELPCDRAADGARADDRDVERALRCRALAARATHCRRAYAHAGWPRLTSAACPVP